MISQGQFYGQWSPPGIKKPLTASGWRGINKMYGNMYGSRANAFRPTEGMERGWKGDGSERKLLPWEFCGEETHRKNQRVLGPFIELFIAEFYIPRLGGSQALIYARQDKICNFSLFVGLFVNLFVGLFVGMDWF
jgi:hypothetical protein